MTTDDTDSLEKRRRIIKYLVQKTKGGKRYFKSKSIAQEIGLSSQEVGSNIPIIKKYHPDLDISQHAETSSTTWKVEETDETDAEETEE
jgi:hypothetical protein